MTPELFLAGSILIDGDAFRLVRSAVGIDDFKNPLCAAVYAAAENLTTSGAVIDPVTIQEAARKAGTELPVDWMTQIMSLTPTAANVVIYAQQVREEARRRRIKTLAESIAENPSATADELLANFQQGMERIQKDKHTSGLRSPADRIRSLFDLATKTGKDQFVPSGFHSLDSILGGGFLRGGLYIIGARPAVGKTTLAINIADQISGNVLFASLEMSEESVTAKQFSRRTGIPASQILTGEGGDELWEKIAMATGAVETSGVYLNSRYDLTPAQLRLLAQDIPDLRAVIVDYLGLILPATPCASTYERVSAVSRELKRMALQLNVPVICLAQLSRGVESRDDKRPRLSDLRDSGAIEQDADSVMFLYRDDYYTGNADGGPSVVELDVAKNRHGSTGKIELLANLRCSFFRERNP